MRDEAAAKIAGEIDTRETQHRAVDKFLLDKAQEYGFVSDSSRVVLMRWTRETGQVAK